ncbi:unnamed protein product [Linum tenue]|uniref:Uncharacterized protein n=1 Tax=Linum tenue TaxID=586396 RepID=A0AAV0LUB3_9ROSI|nr:unnamed protein product [Linum tenue]
MGTRIKIYAQDVELSFVPPVTGESQKKSRLKLGG